MLILDLLLYFLLAGLTFASELGNEAVMSSGEATALNIDEISIEGLLNTVASTVGSEELSLPTTLAEAITTKNESLAITLYNQHQQDYDRKSLLELLERVCSRNFLELGPMIIKTLKEHPAVDDGIDLNVELSKLLHLFALKCRSRVCKMLLEHGADPNFQGSPNDLKLIEKLILEHNLDRRERIIKVFKELTLPESSENYVTSALFQAAFINGDYFAESFVKHFHAQFGNEALFQTLAIAVDAGMDGTFKKLFKILKTRGGFTEFIDKFTCFGHTLLTSAINQGEDAVVKKILSLGADVEKRDKLGLTPLETAIFQNDTDLIELLVHKYNAKIPEMLNKSDLNVKIHKAIAMKVYLVNAITKQSVQQSPKHAKYFKAFANPINRYPIHNKYFAKYCPLNRNMEWLFRFRFAKFYSFYADKKANISFINEETWSFVMKKQRKQQKQSEEHIELEESDEFEDIEESEQSESFEHDQIEQCQSQTLTRRKIGKH